jgi:hypothetical protein
MHLKPSPWSTNENNGSCKLREYRRIKRHNPQNTNVKPQGDGAEYLNNGAGMDF